MDISSLQETLLAQLDGNIAWVKDIAGLFLETMPQMLADLKAAVEGQDAPALQQAAHRIKGTLGTFQALEAAQIASVLETMAEAGDLAGAEAHCAQLEAAVEHLLAVTRQLVSSI